MAQHVAHIPEADLVAFLLGRLGDLEHAAVEEHLTGCPECQNRAAKVDARDTFTDLLASAATSADFIAPGVSEAVADTGSTMLDATRAGLGEGRISPKPTAGDAQPPPLPLSGHPRYRVLRQLGSGGMGSVWLAEHSLMGRHVALKIIRPELLNHLEAIERFRREVQAAAKLQHANIATAHDAEQFGDAHYLVMEYISGQTLAERLRSGRFETHEACRIARDVALGLAHAHANGLIHRDVKPGNVMLTDSAAVVAGAVKILDFGLVVLPHADTQITGAGVVMGTVDYIAPEQAEDPRTADARSDIYSLGCTLYQLLSGRLPFPTGSPLQKLDARRSANPAVIENLPIGLWRVVAKMLARDPAERYQTAAEVANALAPYGEPAATVTLPTKTPPRRNLAIAAEFFAALCALAAGLATYRFVTDAGEIVVESDDTGAKVVIKQGSRLISVVEANSNKKLALRSGDYELELEKSDAALKLSIDTVSVERGKTAVVRIEQGDSLQRDLAQRDYPSVDPANQVPLEKVLQCHTRILFDIATSRDGDTAYTCSADEFTVRAWSLATGQPKATYQHAGDFVHTIALAENGAKLLTAGTTGRIHVWDAQTGAQLPEFFTTSVLAEPGNIIFNIRVSPDGRKVAAGCLTGEVVAWDYATRQVHHVWPEIGGGPTYTLAWSPDSKYLLCGMEALLSVKDVESKQTLSNKADGFHWSDVAWSPNGSKVFGVTWSGHMSAQEAGSWKLSADFFLDSGSHRDARRMAVIRDDFVVVSGVGGQLLAWNPGDKGRAPRAAFTGYHDAIYRIVLSADGQHILAGGETGQLGVWKIPERWRSAPASAIKSQP